MDTVYRRVKSDVALNKKPDTTYTENMKQLHKYLVNGKCDSEEHTYAFSIYLDSYKKEMVEALLISNANYLNVQDVFGISPSILVIYSEVFFDVKKFFTRLDKLSYVENYEDEFGKAIKLRALALGPEYLYHKYGGADLSIDLRKKLLKQIYITNAHKAAEANFTGINSTTSKNSVIFAKMMIKAYEALERFDDAPDTNDDLVKILLATDNAKKKAIVDSTIPAIDSKDII
jgi:hypothetical protein